MRWDALVVVASSAVAMGGCATNTLRVEQARDFVGASNAALAQADLYLREVSRQQREANAALVASDASCVPFPTITLQRPRPGAAATSLCLEPGQRADPSQRTFELAVQPIGPAQLRPRLLLIAAIADYTAALAKIVDAPAPDVGAEIAGFAAKLDQLGAFAGFVAGTDLPSASQAVSGARARAITDLVAFAAGLRREADQVAAIRKRATANGDTVDAALASLREQIDVWARGTIQNAADTRVDALVDIYIAQRRAWDPERRRTAALAIFDARAQARAQGDSANAVTRALDELQAAHTELRALLERDPDLNDEQDRRRAAILRDRILRALELIAGAGRALMGV